MLPSEANTQQHEDLVVNSIRNLMAGIPIDPEVFANEPTSADAEALRLLDSNTGRFAKNYIAKQKNPDPRIVKAMTGGDGFSQEKFRSAVESVEEPTPEEAEQRREGLLEATTFLPGVGGGIDVAKTALDKESTLADFGIAAASFLPGGKFATTALKKADKLVPIFPKPERMAGIKGGQYLDTTTNKDITGRNIANASISVSPEGKPSFLGNIKEVENVGSVGKGKTQIKTNLFKKKAGWKWTKPVEGYEEAPTLISVQQKGKHYYTLNTDFPRGVNLKSYENLPSEPRLRPTLTGELQLGKEIGEISVRGKAHPVYDTIQAKEKGGMIDMRQMQEGGMLGGDLPPEAIADGAVMNGAPIGEVNVPGGGGPVDDGVPTELPEGTFVLNAAAVEYHGTKHINDLIKGSIRNLVKKGVQITGEDLNPDDDVPVAISNGEYIIPPEVARDVGIKKLEDMNERGLEYRKKVEETEKQKAAEQEQAMQSFMGQPMPEEAAQAPIQSETQMPMKDGDEVEATPPDEAEPEAPELTETERKILQFEKMKQEYFEKKAREEREMRLLERAEEQIQKDIEKGVTRDDPALGGYGHPGGGGSTILRMDIAEGGRVPMKDGGFFTNLAQGFMNLFTQDPRDFETAPEAADALMRGEQMPPETPEPIPGGGSIYDEIQRRRESAGDPAEPEQMAQSDSFVPMYPSMPKDGIPDPHTGKTTRPAPWLPKTAQSGGTIERDPQATFLLPQSARQVQGLPVGANTYPTSPQEPFIGTPITGSVLANLPNAAPTPIGMQPQQGFVQPPSQKKSFEPDRLSFQAGGTPKPLVKPDVPFSREGVETSRGFRNNNPMNLANTGTSARKFFGVMGIDDIRHTKDEEEEQLLIFDNIENGLRAGIKNLRNKYDNKPLAQAIDQYSRTDKEAYFNNALRQLQKIDPNIKADTKLNLRDPRLLSALTKLIIQQETSSAEKISDAMIERESERAQKNLPDADLSQQFRLSQTAMFEESKLGT